MRTSTRKSNQEAWEADQEAGERNARLLKGTNCDSVLDGVLKVSKTLSGILCLAVLLCLLLILIQVRGDTLMTIENANFAIGQVAPTMVNMSHSVESMLTQADRSFKSVAGIAQASEIVSSMTAPQLINTINRTLVATESLAKIVSHPVVKLSLDSS